MKKSIGIVLAVSLSLFGCSTATGERTASPPTTWFGQVTQAPIDTLYLQNLRSKYPNLNLVSDEKLISAGQGVCTSLDNGVTLSSILFSGSDGIDASAWGYQVGASIGTYCPRFNYQVRDLIQRYGG